MTTIRVKHNQDNPYVMLSRSAAQDKTLSYEARGLLFYLLSKPDDWIVQINDLAIEKKCGRDKVYRILGELKAAGYITREQYRDKRGRVQWKPYEVRETPLLPPASPLPENPDTELPDTANPDVLLKNESLQKKEYNPARRNALLKAVCVGSYGVSGITSIPTLKQAAARRKAKELDTLLVSYSDEQAVKLVEAGFKRYLDSDIYAKTNQRLLSMQKLVENWIVTGGEGTESEPTFEYEVL